jgi:hypothetical protein
MFIVTCNTSYNIFFLAHHGWTTDRERAIQFPSPRHADLARRKSYKTKRDTTSVVRA